MLATPTRRARRQVIVCGRKHCGKCSRFRHVSDYSVDEWADLERTTPRRLRHMCRTCAERDRRQRARRRPARKEHVPAHVVERRAVNRLLREMCRADRYLYQMEGILPIGDWSLADEDHDPTPVPQGCPSCYLHGGHPCETCPDADVKAKVRAARKEGRIIGDPNLDAWGAAALALR